MSIKAFIAQGHGRSTDGSSNPYPAGWEETARLFRCVF